MREECNKRLFAVAEFEMMEHRKSDDLRRRE